MAGRVEGDFVEYSQRDLLPASPLVSVLVLSYNHAQFLQDAIESILKQKTSFPVEIIIGDDASQDESLEIALAFQQQRPGAVRVLRSFNNAGMHSNHRRLVMAARGKYIAYCEGDDYWNSDRKLEVQIAVLEKQTDVGLVHSEFAHIVWTAGGWRALPRYWRHHHVSIPSGHVFEELARSNFVQTCTMVLRTELARKFMDSGLNIDGYRVADWALALYVAATHELQYLDEPTATYRQVRGSVTNSGVAADIERARNSLTMVGDIREHFGLAELCDGPGLREVVELHILGLSLRAGDRLVARAAYDWLRANAPQQLSMRKRIGGALISRSRTAASVFRMLAAADRRRQILRAYTDAPEDPRC